MQVVSSDSNMSLLQLHQAHPQRYPFLLQSTADHSSHHSATSQFDILFALPGQVLVLNHRYELFLDDVRCNDNDFLKVFDRLWKKENHNQPSSEVNEISPFNGGWFIFLAYELVSQIEKSLGLLPTEEHLPVALAVRCPAAIIHNKHTGKQHLIAEESVSETAMQIIHRDMQAQGEVNIGIENTDIGIEKLQEEDEAVYLDNISRVKKYIYDGDVFQVNLSRQWQATSEKDNSSAIYQRLCSTNPGPFAGIARISNECTIVSSSPERLVSCKDKRVYTRPIAGTYPRDKNQKVDHSLAGALIENPKERAEHIMLIDLERNDLGRVCIPGSVEVSEMMSVESYQHVHHIVSQVEGSLKDDCTPVDIIRAVYPGGTITGCPKVRCMEIIRDLENCPRGAYTGSMGYINKSGDMDLNILIRTLVNKNKDITFRAGSGLVADSDPQRELDETRAKAKGLINAVTGSSDQE
jgi:anthranilate synthase component 1